METWNYLKENLNAYMMTVIIIVVAIMRHGAPIIERWIKVKEKWKKVGNLGKDAFISSISENNDFLKSELERSHKREEDLAKQLKELRNSKNKKDESPN